MEHPLPVLCEQCRTQGVAGDNPFAYIADLLNFRPVPRRAHADGWNEERQRAFISALVITGSPRRAARAIGKHANGAEQLRHARGSASFAEAWDAAIGIYREREHGRLKSNLAELAAKAAAEDRTPFAAADGDDDDVSVTAEQEYLEARERIHSRFSRARILLLTSYADDPAKRAAWEVLVGPCDWERARKGERQDDEPLGEWRQTKADMVLTVNAGYLHDVAGAGPDAMEPLRAAFAAVQAGKAAEAAAGIPPPPEPTTQEEAVANFGRHLLAAGWTETETGWRAPDDGSDET